MQTEAFREDYMGTGDKLKGVTWQIFPCSSLEDKFHSVEHLLPTPPNTSCTEHWLVNTTHAQKSLLMQCEDATYYSLCH